MIGCLNGVGGSNKALTKLLVNVCANILESSDAKFELMFP